MDEEFRELQKEMKEISREVGYLKRLQDSYGRGLEIAKRTEGETNLIMTEEIRCTKDIIRKTTKDIDIKTRRMVELNAELKAIRRR